jgi:peptidyl-dipeptidase Dcp
MSTQSKLVAAAAIGVLLTSGAEAASPAVSGGAKPVADIPLLQPWTGDYGGYPRFDLYRVDQLKPALDAGMAAQLAEIRRIAQDPTEPTFDNTLAALERSGRGLDRVEAVYGIYASNLEDDAVQAVEREMAPRLASFRDHITQNEALFRRIEAVYEARAKSGLTPEQQRLAWLWYTNFVRRGARLDAPAKARMTAINQRLATLQTSFSQNLLADEQTYTLLTQEAELAGLPDSVRSGAAVAAEARGHKGHWAILNTRSSVEPFLTYSTRRDLRERVWRAFVDRGDKGDAHDNNAIITEQLALRFERAQLLGYATHAHWRLENSMARTPENAMKLMEEVWPAAVARVREEVADMQAIADAEGGGVRIEPWDYRYYAEKVRKAKYDLDETQLKPYLQLDNLREAMFYMARELYGFVFVAVEPGKVPVYHPDVRVWQVTDPQGRHVGLWYFDPYARPGKKSGAWMSAYRSQERMDGPVPTIVSNNLNLVRGRPGEPVLISWDDARTLFHEFGHAVQGLSSNVTYPSLAGTSIARDAVELSSQLHEHWLATPEVLRTYARHYQTGAPLPQELIDKVQKADKFNQGFITVEYLSSALVDMKLHLAGGQKIDPDAFERDMLKSLGMPAEIVMRHRTPQFAHIFASDGYSAGYYSYLWADTLSADAWEAFVEAGGPWDKAVARRLQQQVLSIGNTVEPADAYRSFRGRDAGIGALMRDRGFPYPTSPAPQK